jgi:hypothetical protein
MQDRAALALHEGAGGAAQIVLVDDRRRVPVSESVLIAQPSHPVIEPEKRWACL